MATQSLSITFTAPSSAVLTDMLSYAAKFYGYQAGNPLTVIQFMTQSIHDEIITYALQQKQIEAAAAASAAVNYSSVT